MPETRYLIFNGNTNFAITDRMVRLAAEHFGSDADVFGLTAETGAAYIRTPEQCLKACEAVRHLLGQAPDAVDFGILGCFGLPDVERLREQATFTLIDLLEGGILAAQQLSDRYAILTVGGQWPSMLQREMERRGLAGSCIGIQALPQLAFDPLSETSQLADWLREPVARLIDELNPGAVLLGGAAFSGLGEALQASFDIPVIDSFSATLALVENLQQVHEAWPETLPFNCPGAASRRGLHRSA